MRTEAYSIADKVRSFTGESQVLQSLI